MSATNSYRCACSFGVDRRCKHGIIDPDWCYDCFYEEDPEDDSL